MAAPRVLVTVPHIHDRAAPYLRRPEAAVHDRVPAQLFETSDGQSSPSGIREGSPCDTVRSCAIFRKSR